MNNNSLDKEKLMKTIMQASGGKIKESAISGAASGNMNELMSVLSHEDREKLKAALADKNALKAMLSSDAAKKLLEGFAGKGKANG